MKIAVAPVLLLLWTLTGAGCATMFERPGALSGAKGWPRAEPTTPRSNHAATKLKDGRVLVTGGRGAFERADLFDPATNTWTPAAKMPNRYANHAAARLPDGRVFVFGGNTVVRPANSNAAIYDPRTNRWIGGVGQGYVLGRTAHTATALPTGRVLLAGGDHRGASTFTVTDRARLYDPASAGSPVLLQNQLRFQCLSRLAHTATRLDDGTILLAGGAGTRGAASETEAFVPGPDVFEERSPMGFERTQHTATKLPSGQVLVTGGYGRPATTAPNPGRCAVEEPEPLFVMRGPESPVGVWAAPARPPPSTVLATTERYDPATNEWVPAHRMTAPRRAHRTVLTGGGALSRRVVVIGGLNDAGALASVEVLTPGPGGGWRSLPRLAAHRVGHTATPLDDGRILVVAGEARGARTGVVELLHPL